MPKQPKSSPAMAAANSTASNPAGPAATGSTPSGGPAAAPGLPTPAQSTEIHAKPAFSALSFDGAFALPPAAISSPPNSRNSSIISSDKAESDSSYNPDAIASSSAAKAKQSAKRKSSTGKAAAALQRNDYTVPPPPTRSRKIIQMKPRGQPDDESTTNSNNNNNNNSTASMAVAPHAPTATNQDIAASAAPASGTTGTKRKQAASATTAQGRKMARKTAHSLIERRRRSKMNEEFGVLKDMIPACAGQEMHKLAILQASIDYMRYLEKCLADLKTAHASCAVQPQIRSPVERHVSRQSTINPSTRSSSTAPPSEDSEMVDLPPIRQVLANHNQYPSGHSSISPPQPQAQQSKRYAPISPAINPLGSGSPPHSTSKYQPPLPGTSSIHPSPLVEGQHNRSMHTLSAFALTSPIVHPMSGHHSYTSTSAAVAGPEEQEEATAALLMLNTDRRSWSERGAIPDSGKTRPATDSGSATSGAGFVGTPGSARSMSVRDLLTG